MTTYHARLEKWVVDNNGRLHGDIYDDTKQRFVDGEFVVTTPILAGIVKEGNQVVTKSGTTYLLGRMNNGS